MSEMIQMAFNDEPSLTGPKSLEVRGTVAEGNANWSDDLDAPTRDFVQRKTDEIHGQLKRTADGIIKIGLNLIAVKEHLPHGQFLPWLKAEFDMTEMSAVRYMQVARRFGKSNIVLDFPATVLYALAAPSTSDEIVKKVQSGEIPVALDAIKAEKLAEKHRADEAERAKEVAEQQMKRLWTKW